MENFSAKMNSDSWNEEDGVSSGDYSNMPSLWWNGSQSPPRISEWYSLYPDLPPHSAEEIELTEQGKLVIQASNPDGTSLELEAKFRLSLPRSIVAEEVARNMGFNEEDWQLHPSQLMPYLEGFRVLGVAPDVVIRFSEHRVIVADLVVVELAEEGILVGVDLIDAYDISIAVNYFSINQPLRIAKSWRRRCCCKELKELLMEMLAGDPRLPISIANQEVVGQIISTLISQ